MVHTLKKNSSNILKNFGIEILQRMTDFDFQPDKILYSRRMCGKFFLSLSCPKFSD
jgi:hypothetical protein